MKKLFILSLLSFVSYAGLFGGANNELSKGSIYVGMPLHIEDEIDVALQVNQGDSNRNSVSVTLNTDEYLSVFESNEEVDFVKEVMNHRYTISAFGEKAYRNIRIEREYVIKGKTKLKNIAFLVLDNGKANLKVDGYKVGSFLFFFDTKLKKVQSVNTTFNKLDKGVYIREAQKSVCEVETLLELVDGHTDELINSLSEDCQ